MGQPEPVETYSTSPHLFSALRIPDESPGRCPGPSAAAGLEAEDLEDIGETGRTRSQRHAAGTATRGGPARDSDRGEPRGPRGRAAQGAGPPPHQGRGIAQRWPRPRRGGHRGAAATSAPG